MMKLRQVFGISVFVALGILLSTAGAFAATKPWNIPKEDSARKNPIKADKASIEAGKAIYMKNCANCHGEKADGKGPAASALNPKPPALTGKAYHKANTDGDLYYKIAVGRMPMPGWEVMLSEKDIWNVVNYLRSLQ